MLYNRIRATTTTTGTGTYTVGAALDGFKDFTGLANGTLVEYVVEFGTAYEIAIGTKNGSTIERTTLRESSTGSWIDWSAGTKKIFCDIPAQKLTVASASGNIPVANTSGKLDYSYLDAQISSGEITAGIETNTRRMSPADIVDLIDTHGSGGGISLPIAQSDVTGLVAALAAKASSPIAQSDVTGLVTAISDLNTEVDGKAETIHATQHEHGGSDPVGTATPGANAIIKADADGKIGSGWIDPADVVAHYNSLIAQVSGGEITAGTETSIRRFSPADVVALIAAHETVGGGSSWTYTAFNYTGSGSGSVATPLIPVDNEHLLVSSTTDVNVYIGTIVSPTEGMSFRVTKISANGKIQVGTTGTLAEADRTSLASVADSVEYRYLGSKWYAFNLRQTALTGVVVSSGTTYSQTRGTNAIIRSNNNITVSLPSAPMQYQRQRVTKDTVDTYLVTIDLNGETLYDSTTTLYLDSRNSFIEFVFFGGYWFIAVDGRATRVTSTERTNGTVTYPRAFSPSDIKSMITTHAPAGGGLTLTSIKTANYTAVAGELVRVNGSGATADITITLPATAAECGVLLVTDMAAGWKLVINRNGNTVNGMTDTTLLALRYEAQMLRFYPESSGYAAVRQSPPKDLSCYNFDGSTHYAVANSAAINITGALSISFWIYPTGTGSQIIWGGYDTSSPFNGYGVSVGGSSGLDRIELWDGTSWRAGGRPVRNKWSHVLVVHNGTNSVSFYIDGRLESTSVANALSSYTGVKAFGGVSGGTSRVNALVQDYRIFNAALTASNGRRLYGNGRGCYVNDIANCVLWYMGDEASGSSCIDRISGNNGTVTGSGGFGSGIIQL